MDERRFDGVARSLASGQSRRRLAALGALASLGLIAGPGAPGESEAKKKSCKKKKKKACIGKCGTVTYTCKKKQKQIACSPCPEVCQVCASGCAFSTVQAAINAASPGATISICAGTFTENLRIDRNLTLAGAGRGVTILDGNAANSVIAINPDLTAVTIRDLTITNGKSPGVGGGISNGKAQTTLVNVLITGNEATTRGGGFDVDVSGKVTLTNCSVTKNHARDFGGGAFTYGTVACTNSSMSGNTVGNPPTASDCAQFAPGSGCDTCGTARRER